MTDKLCAKLWTLTLSSETTVYPDRPFQQGWTVKFCHTTKSVFTKVDPETGLDRKLTEEEFDTLVEELKSDYFFGDKVETIKI